MHPSLSIVLTQAERKNESLSCPRPIDENLRVTTQPVVEPLNDRVEEEVDCAESLVGLAGDFLYAGELRCGRSRFDGAD